MFKFVAVILPLKTKKQVHVTSTYLRYHRSSGGSRNGAIGRGGGGGGGGCLEGRPGAGPTHSPTRGYGGAL